jgi:HK97 family phage major capsid protein
VQIETDTSIKFDYDVTAIRAVMRVDVQVMNPKAVLVMTGVT